MQNTSQSTLQQILIEVQLLSRQSRCWLSVEDVANYLDLKVNTIYKYVNDNRIPFKKIPGSSKLIFSRWEIDAWLENGSNGQYKIEEAKTEANRILEEIRGKSF